MEQTPTHVVRDRLIVIFILLVFGIFFWMAFEQSGNTLNVWASQHTDRVIGGKHSPPPVELPEATQPRIGGTGWEIPATWFQSVNSGFIILLGPVFAWLWVWLDRRGMNPSTPAKIATGVFLMGVAYFPMVIAAKLADVPSQARLEQLTSRVTLSEFAAGQLVYDSQTKTLSMSGILTDLERDRILQQSADPAFKQAVIVLTSEADDAATSHSRRAEWRVSVPLTAVPEGFDLRWSNLDHVSYDPATKLLRTSKPLDDKSQKRLLLAGANAELRRALWEIWRDSSRYRVSGLWLLGFYLLATCAELCLSPVGLSMVSKLAPVRFATLLMGLWFLQNFVANWLAGYLGEFADKLPPAQYFTVFVVTSIVPAVILYACLRKVKAMMHGIH